MFLRRMYVKRPGWKFSVRLAKVINHFNSSGCRNDDHNIEHDEYLQTEVCDCDRQNTRRLWYDKGFRDVGFYFGWFTGELAHVLYKDGQIVLEHHACGR